MAERRMFAKTIIDSDAFFDLSNDAQLLYFHLAMRADDDGFINNPKSIMRMCECQEEDLQALYDKKFLILFENGVVAVKHWKIHNYIRKDTYTETKYKEEKALLELDENNAYRLIRNEPTTNPSQDRNEAVTGSSTQVRIGKDSIDKVNIEKESEKEKEPPKPTKPRKNKYGEFQNVLLSDKEYENLASSLGVDLRDKAIAFLDEYIEEKGYKSKSHNLAIKRWVVDAVKERGKAQPTQTQPKNDYDSFMDQLAAMRD